MEGAQGGIVALVIVPQFGRDDRSSRESAGEDSPEPPRASALTEIPDGPPMPLPTPCSFPSMAAISKWRWPEPQAMIVSPTDLRRRDLAEPESHLVDEDTVLQTERGEGFIQDST